MVRCRCANSSGDDNVSMVLVECFIPLHLSKRLIKYHSQIDRVMNERRIRWLLMQWEVDSCHVCFRLSQYTLMKWTKKYRFRRGLKSFSRRVFWYINFVFTSYLCENIREKTNVANIMVHPVSLVLRRLFRWNTMNQKDNLLILHWYKYHHISVEDLR